MIGFKRLLRTVMGFQSNVHLKAGVGKVGLVGRWGEGEGGRPAAQLH